MATQRMRDRATHHQAGAALLVVMLVMLAIAGSAAVFIWYMNQVQSRAGLRYRSAMALEAAEAGIYRALSVLEWQHLADESGGQRWRPAAYTETIQLGPRAGRFTIDFADDIDGAIIITSVGEVGGTSRRLRARVYMASPALLAAVYGTGVLRFGGPPASTLIVPYGVGLKDRPWVHIAAGDGVVFASTSVSINDPSLAFALSPGPVDGPAGVNAMTGPPPSEPARILLSRRGDLSLHRGGQPVDVQQLQAMGLRLDEVAPRPDRVPGVPEVDAAYYAALAASNTANRTVNEQAGKYVGNGDLANKRDSLYTSDEFEQVQLYLAAGSGPSWLQGVIYVKGAVLLPEGQELRITDGALVLESAAFVSRGAFLEITHSAVSRRLPGLIVLGEGALAVNQDARVRIHGLVHVNRMISIDEGAQVDIVGAMLGNDGRVSGNLAGTLTIRYDPAVLGTPGLRTPAGTPAVAWVAAWEELP